MPNHTTIRLAMQYLHANNTEKRYNSYLEFVFQWNNFPEVGQRYPFRQFFNGQPQLFTKHWRTTTAFVPIGKVCLEEYNMKNFVDEFVKMVFETKISINFCKTLLHTVAFLTLCSTFTNCLDYRISVTQSYVQCHSELLKMHYIKCCHTYIHVTTQQLAWRTFNQEVQGSNPHQHRYLV